MLRGCAIKGLKPFNRPFWTSAVVHREFSSRNDASSILGSLTKVAKDDRGPCEEFSVAFTCRALNQMSDPFRKVMQDLNKILKFTYNAEKVAIIPGAGTFGMESVARQFATNEHVMVIRNGWFSYRWTEILELGSIPKSCSVLKAQPVPAATDSDFPHPQYVPHPIDDVVAKILEEKPAVVFAPHVETSVGMILPDSYIKKVTEAVHEVGGLFVLDCVASGSIWVDMKDLGIDVAISAPQKGWSGPAGAGLVMMSKRAGEKMQITKETSFSMSLRSQAASMDAFEAGSFGAHTSLPTETLRTLHEVAIDALNHGLPELKQAQLQIGREARAALDSRGLVSVTAPEFQAPGILVYYSPMETDNIAMYNLCKQHGLQIAPGVPWMIDEPSTVKSFRLGLFGLDKLSNVTGTVNTLTKLLDPILEDLGHVMPQPAGESSAHTASVG